MKDYSRKVSMHCPICGNDQFSTLDDKYDELFDAPDDIKLQCSDCHNIFTKGELLAENQEVIDIAESEMIDAVMKDFNKRLEKVLKKWK